MRWWKKLMLSGAVMAVVGAIAVLIVKVLDRRLNVERALAEVAIKPELEKVKKEAKLVEEYVQERVAEIEKEDVDEIIKAWKATYGGPVI